MNGQHFRKDTSTFDLKYPCLYYGDKRPNFYMSHRSTFLQYTNFNTDLKVITILRGIYSIAKSFKVRAEKGTSKWPKLRSVEAAVIQFNRQNKLFIDMDTLYTSRNHFFIDYKNQFGDPNSIQDMFKFLNITISISEAHQMIKKLEIDSICGTKRKIEPSIIDTVNKYLDYDLCKKVESRCGFSLLY